PICTEKNWIRHDRLQLDMDTGLGVVVGGVPGEPQIALRWSDDGGRTWSNEHLAGAGKLGEYKKRVIWRRLGSSRDRIYEIVSTDATPWRIVEGYLEATPGFAPTERLTSELRKRA